MLSLKSLSRSKLFSIVCLIFTLDTIFPLGRPPSKVSRNNSSEATAAPISAMTPSASRQEVSLLQRFSNTNSPSTDFPAVNGQYHTSGKSNARNESTTCSAQMESDRESHGSMNPVSFEFDQSTGYLPTALGVSHRSRLSSQRPLQDSQTAETGHLSLESFLELLSSERLNRMPHRASRLDRIIRLLEGM